MLCDKYIFELWMPFFLIFDRKVFAIRVLKHGVGVEWDHSGGLQCITPILNQQIDEIFNPEIYGTQEPLSPKIVNLYRETTVS